MKKSRNQRIEELLAKRAKAVADKARLHILDELLKAVATTKRQGGTVTDAAHAISRRLKKLTHGPDNYVELVVRNNMQTAYNSGKVRTFLEPKVRARRPFWVYWAKMDSRTSKLCSRLHGTVRPAGDAWFMRRVPPLHHFCRSTIRALTPTQADEWYGGVTKHPPRTKAGAGWGRLAERGWRPRLGAIDSELVAIYRSKK